MSYRRKVHCSYCRETGHNRRACPTMKKEALTNPDGYAADCYNENILRKSRTSSTTTRTCSWCKETGHNKTSCQRFAKEQFEVQMQYAEYRGNFKKKCLELGIAVDALVTCEYQLQLINEDDAMPFYKTVELLYKIEDIKFNRVKPNYGGSVFTLTLINYPGLKYERAHHVADLETLLRDYKIESPMSTEFVEEYFIKDPLWATGRSGLPDQYA